MTSFLHGTPDRTELTYLQVQAGELFVYCPVCVLSSVYTAGNRFLLLTVFLSSSTMIVLLLPSLVLLKHFSKSSKSSTSLNRSKSSKVQVQKVQCLSPAKKKVDLSAFSLRLITKMGLHTRHPPITKKFLKVSRLHMRLKSMPLILRKR